MRDCEVTVCCAVVACNVANFACKVGNGEYAVGRCELAVEVVVTDCWCSFIATAHALGFGNFISTNIAYGVGACDCPSAVVGRGVCICMGNRYSAAATIAVKFGNIVVAHKTAYISIGEAIVLCCDVRQPSARKRWCALVATAYALRYGCTVRATSISYCVSTCDGPTAVVGQCVCIAMADCYRTTTTVNVLGGRFVIANKTAKVCICKAVVLSGDIVRPCASKCRFALVATTNAHSVGSFVSTSISYSIGTRDCPTTVVR